MTTLDIPPAGSAWMFVKSASPPLYMTPGESVCYVTENDVVLVINNELHNGYYVNVAVGNMVGVMHYTWFSSRNISISLCTRLG